MSLLLMLLAIAFIGVAGWGFQSVMAGLAKSYPQEPVDTISRRFEVDEFIWGPRAPLALRRQFIATQACAIPASGRTSVAQRAASRCPYLRDYCLLLRVISCGRFPGL